MDTVKYLPNAVVMFSTADWRERYWTNKQHVARRLADRGVNVLYIESIGLRRPGANVRDVRRIADRLWRAVRSPEQVDAHLWIHAPLTIPVARGRPLVERFNSAILKQVINRWLRKRGAALPLVWTYHPYIAGAVKGIDRHALVYHCVDDLAAIPGVDAKAFASAEEMLLREADVVFATSPSLTEHCRAVAGERVFFERNVADIDHFAAARGHRTGPGDIEAIPHPRLTYVGVLSSFKLDLDLIEQTALALPKCHFVMIGDEPERQHDAAIARMRHLPNVHFIGFRPYKALPEYLGATDIALLPNLTSGYMAGVFPMKLYEYLAAGRPVVSTNLSALNDVSGPILKAEGAEEWVRAISAVLKDPPASLSLNDPRLSDYSWDARLDRMLDQIAKVDHVR